MPKMTSADISSVVITGRRMQSSGRFMAMPSALVDAHAGAVDQQHLAFGDDALARLQALVDDHAIRAGRPGGDRPLLDGVVRLHDEDERASGGALQRDDRNA